VLRDGRGAVLLEGREAMRAEFSSLFEGSPKLRADVLGRLDAGPYVVLRERIEGYGGEPIDGIMVYHVAGDTIDHAVWLA
jgi:hypothetical protein